MMSFDMTQPSVIDYLKQLQQQGVSHVEIDDEAREILREFYRRGAASPKARKSTPSSAPAPSASVTPPTDTKISITGHSAAEKIDSLK
ncbi:MAG: hypothetical protein QNL80_07270 [Akkermansiaceae bacterium]